MKAIILSAPPGWGKTRNAEALRREFGCTRVVDGWNPRSDAVIPGALHLTNVHLTNVHPADMRLADTLALGLKGNVHLVVRGWKGGAA